MKMTKMTNSDAREAVAKMYQEFCETHAFRQEVLDNALNRVDEYAERADNGCKYVFIGDRFNEISKPSEVQAFQEVAEDVDDLVEEIEDDILQWKADAHDLTGDDQAFFFPNLTLAKASMYKYFNEQNEDERDYKEFHERIEEADRYLVEDEWTASVCSADGMYDRLIQNFSYGLDYPATAKQLGTIEELEDDLKVAKLARDYADLEALERLYQGTHQEYQALYEIVDKMEW